MISTRPFAGFTARSRRRPIARRLKPPWCRRWTTSNAPSLICWSNRVGRGRWLLTESPLAVAITVPRVGWSMEEGTFQGWLKREGDRVKPGDMLFLLESEKATEEIETLERGILRIPADAPATGAVVKVGQVLAYLVAEGEAAPGHVAGAHGGASHDRSAHGRRRDPGRAGHADHQGRCHKSRKPAPGIQGGSPRRCAHLHGHDSEVGRCRPAATSTSASPVA